MTRPLIKYIPVFLAAMVPATAPISAQATIPSALSEKPLLIDTDMALDDWMAILYLLHRPDVSIEAITVSGTGEATCDTAAGHPIGAIHALELIELSGKSDANIPVACGSTHPIQGEHAFPSQWRAEADAGYGANLPKSSRNPSLQDASEVIIERLKQAPLHGLSILTIGPETNLGNALTRRPDLTINIDTIYIMGGAIHVPGNLSDGGVTNNRVAEYNIYVDPTAANIVFASGAKIKLIALDGTNHAPLDQSFLNQLASDANTPTAKFIAQTLRQNEDSLRSGLYFYMWDSLAAAVVTQDDLCQYERDAVVVDKSESPISGQTRIDPLGYPIQVCVDADGPRFRSLFLTSVRAGLLTDRP